MIKKTMPARADADTQDGFSNDAPAAPKIGRSAKPSEGQKSGKGPKPSAATEKVSGAGPAIAEHSKDAKRKRSQRAGCGKADRSLQKRSTSSAREFKCVTDGSSEENAWS